MSAAAFASWPDALSRRGFLAIAGVILFIAAGACARGDEAPAEPAAAPVEKLQYNRDIRPILAENCFSCHGPDSASRQADLRLDKRDAAIELAAITPGDVDASELVRRIGAEADDERMPPPETKKFLTAEQRELLARWIREGAEYQPHWSLIAPVRPTPPEVKNSWWVRNPIDQFIAARLESAGLAPAAEADRTSLARRVSLDLTGLPPAPEEVAAFVNDPSPNAYERFVDKLLASPRWGEHRGRYWLDVARYADTHGIHFDNYREMWSYRDWVINAFNANMPFDKFTIENLAGDLLPGATLEDRIGSGFNRCNITTNEGGAIDEEYRVLYARDRTETTAQTWLGLTAGCAVCHDHKFDPLLQKEFYSLSAFFNNTTQNAMDGNVKDTPPIEFVARPDDVARWNELGELEKGASAKLDERKKEAGGAFQQWLSALDQASVAKWIPVAGLQFAAMLDEGKDDLHYTLEGQTHGAPLRAPAQWVAGEIAPHAVELHNDGILEVPGAGDFEGDQPATYAAWIKLPADSSGGSVLARMDEADGYRGWDMWIEDRRLGGHVIHRFPENALKVLSKQQLPADQWVHAALVYDGSRKPAGLKVFINGVRQETETKNDNLTESSRTKTPLVVGRRSTGSALQNTSLQDVRVYARALDDKEVGALAAGGLAARWVAESPEQRAKNDTKQLYDWWLSAVDEVYQRLQAEHVPLVDEQTAIRQRGTVAHVMHERDEPAMAFVLNRGEYAERREEVKPATPAMLPPMPPELPRNRLGLAEWLIRPENPLTARVTVNRFWQEIFGTGLVKTAGDFGVSGQLPSHPELLDWLAVEFRESGWDVKRLFKLIVMSAAYRQSAVVTPEKLERDPDNRLLSRGPRYRMDAEMVRDLALEAGGLLSSRIGGASVKPYQPPGVWEAVAMLESNTHTYQQDSGEALYRRSLYTFWKRSAPPASMEIFNAPSRETCTVCRERTNTPLQALVTLNDPQFIEASRRLAETAIEKGAGADERCRFMAKRILSRELREPELEVLRKSIATLNERYQANPEEAAKLIHVGQSTPDEKISAPELATWTLVASELLNLDEAINK